MAEEKTKGRTGFRNGNLFCFNCGVSEAIPLPMEVGAAASLMMGFAEKHEDCKETWHEPKNNPEGKSEEENEKWWIENGEHGISSKTMFKYLTDSGTYQTIDREYPPSDADDFRRCHLLMVSVPSYKDKLHRMKAVSQVWSNLVDNWDKLTEMLIEPKEPKSTKMYDLMKSLGA